MTKIKAEIIADSKSEFGNRITTMVVTFPRYILAELNTHRMLSKNSASSRAIPFNKLLDSVLNNPFIPIAWMKDHPGMQGTEYFENPDTIRELERQWLQARTDAVNRAIDLSQKGLTKQLVNRLLEPFMWHTVIITATDWENFFALRCPRYELPNSTTYHRSRKEIMKIASQGGNITTPEMTEIDWLKLNKGQADIHMMAFAEAMWDAYNESEPKVLGSGHWHIPFGDNIEEGLLKLAESSDLNDGTVDRMKIKIATARCARISYTVVGEESKAANYENDIKLHDRLAASGHWSPFEHCAKAMVRSDAYSGNFKAFTQYRKLFTNENIL